MLITSLLFGRKNGAGAFEFLKTRAPIRSIPQHLNGIVTRRISGNHIYLEAGSGKPLIFCHGLFGGIFNIDKVASELSRDYRFIMPYLPMYDLPLKNCRVKILGEYLFDFVNQLQLNEAVVIGNSMGGGAASYYASNSENVVKGLVLCGSSGLTNIPLSKGFFKRKNYDFVRSATQDIFYNRSIPPEEMSKDVFQALQQTELVIRSIRFTKSAIKEKMYHELTQIQSPSLLIWGKQDPVTPAEAAPKFKELIPDSELIILEECGHVPQQEKPEEFLLHLNSFLKKINY